MFQQKYIKYKTKYLEKKKLDGGRLSAYVDPKNNLDSKKFENALHNLIPLNYNQQFPVYDLQGNILIDSADKSKQYILNSNLCLEEYQYKQEKKTTNTYTFNDLLTYKSIKINYRGNNCFIPLYMLHLNYKYSFISNFRKVINITTEEKKDLNQINEILEELFLFDDNFNIIDIKLKIIILSRYIFINKFRELLNMIYGADNTNTKDYLVTDKMVTKYKKNKYEIIKTIINNKNGDEDLVKSNNSKETQDPIKIEIKNYIKKIVYIKKYLENIFKCNDDTSSKINLPNLIDICTVINNINSIPTVNNNNNENMKKLTEMYDKNKEYHEKDMKDNIKIYLEKEIIEIYKYYEFTEKIKIITGNENMSLIIFLTYFKLRLKDKLVIRNNNYGLLHALPVNLSSAIDNLKLTEDKDDNENKKNKKIMASITTLPIFYNYTSAKYKTNKFSPCVESALISMFKLLFYSEMNYSFVYGGNKCMKMFYDKIIVKHMITDLEKSEDCINDFIDLIYNAKRLNFMQDGYELDAINWNILMVFSYLIFDCDFNDVYDEDEEIIVLKKINEELSKYNKECKIDVSGNTIYFIKNGEKIVKIDNYPGKHASFSPEINNIKEIRKDIPIKLKYFELFSQDLSNEELIEEDLSGVNFTETNLSETYIENSNLSKTIFKETVLINTFFNKVDLSGAIFSDVPMSQASFMNVNMSESKLTDCKLQYSRMIEINFTKAILTNIDFTMETIREINFSNATLKNCSFKNNNLSKIDFSNATLKDCSFFSATLFDINFSNAILENIDMREGNLNNINFCGATLDDSLQLRDAKLYGVNIERAIMSYKMKNYFKQINDDTGQFTGLNKVVVKRD